MSINVSIANGRGVEASVNQDGELSVITASHPPLLAQKVQPFRQYLTDDGLSSGNKDMGVDGSITNVDYYIKASSDCDRHITSLNFIVGYATSGQPNEWADGTALVNGMRLFYENIRGESEIHEAIKSNQDMFRLSFSPVITSWEVRHVDANNDYGYFISVDLTKMGLPFGIKMDIGTTQKLVCRIRDNAGASANSFNCIAYGFDRFE